LGMFRHGIPPSFLFSLGRRCLLITRHISPTSNLPAPVIFTPHTQLLPRTNSHNRPKTCWTVILPERQRRSGWWMIVRR
jgi:hypothetical protein